VKQTFIIQNCIVRKYVFKYVRISTCKLNVCDAFFCTVCYLSCHLFLESIDVVATSESGVSLTPSGVAATDNDLHLPLQSAKNLRNLSKYKKSMLHRYLSDSVKINATCSPGAKKRPREEGEEVDCSQDSKKLTPEPMRPLQPRPVLASASAAFLGHSSPPPFLSMGTSGSAAAAFLLAAMATGGPILPLPLPPSHPVLPTYIPPPPVPPPPSSSTWRSVQPLPATIVRTDLLSRPAGIKTHMHFTTYKLRKHYNDVIFRSFSRVECQISFSSVSPSRQKS